MAKRKNPKRVAAGKKAAKARWAGHKKKSSKKKDGRSGPRSAKQKAHAKKLGAMQKAKGRMKRGERGFGVYDAIAARRKNRMVIPIFTEVCVKGHEGKMYKVEKITSTCPSGFHTIRTKK